MRLLVYTDYPYARVGEDVLADRAFALFVGRLAPSFERLLAAGRLDPSGEAAKYPIGPGVEFAALPFYPALTSPLSALAGMARSLRSFWRLLDEVDATWLLGPHPLAICFALLARARRKRVILGVRQDMVPYVRARHPGKRLIVAAAAILEGAFRLLGRGCPVVAVGPQIAENYGRARQVLEVAVSLVPESEVVELERSLAREWPASPTLLSVGRLDAEKNPLLLADVLAELRRDGSEWRLTVAGDGPLRGELERRAEALGVADALELRGYVPNHLGLRDLYRESDALLHVSWTEGLPQVLLEALAAGIPMIATAVGGVGASLEGRCVLIGPGDAVAAADAARRIASDPALRDRLRTLGHEYIRARTAEAETARVATFILGGEVAAMGAASG